ncbi:MAG: hypothetical protein KatS3mg068_2147 [Candidatus Sericytochromatia bacterium]|nr:MAG: hypothetical protein KatS3mg068_2147 [Candidatus Sericytochromatia bacterium]
MQIGIRLKKIKEEKLYLEKGFKTFFDFIKNSEIDLSPILVDRFISITERKKYRKNKIFRYKIK